MSRLALLFVVSVVLGGAARADGYYIAESVGETQVHGGLSAYDRRALLQARVAIGMRRGAWAVELWGAGDFALDYETDRSDPSRGLMTGGADLKYVATIAAHLAVFARAGLGGLSASAPVHSVDGPGGGLGGGAQLFTRGRLAGVPLAAALVIDAGADVYRLTGDHTTYGELTHVAIGFALGTDF